MSGQVFPLRLLGVDEGGDPKGLPPGMLLKGENCQMDLVGRVAKRFGTKGLAKAIVGGGTIGAGLRLVTRGEDLALIDGTSIYAWSDALSAWKTIDRVPSLSVAQRPLIDSPRGTEAVDIAISGDLLISVFQAGPSATGGPIYLQIESIATRAKVLAPLLVSANTSGSFPRLLLHAGNAVVVWTTSGGSVGVAEVSLTTFALGIQPTIVFGLVANSLLDALIVGDTLYVACELTGGAGLKVATFNAAAGYAPLTSVTLANGAGLHSVSISVDATNLWVLWSAQTVAGTYATVLDPTTLATITAPVSLSATIADAAAVMVLAGTSTQALFCITWPGAGANVESEGVETMLLTAAALATVAHTPRQTWGTIMHSKPWQTPSGRIFMAVLTNVTSNTGAHGVFPSAVVIEVRIDPYVPAVATHEHAATLLNQIAWFMDPLQTGRRCLTTPALSGSDAWVAAASADRLPTNYGAPLALSFSSFRLRLADPTNWQSRIIGPNAFLSGGAPALFDGSSCFAALFAHPPLVVCIPGAGASGSMVAGDYYYVAVFEWRDANGILHRSIPSQPALAQGVPGSGSVTLHIATSCLDAKQNETSGYGAHSASPVRVAIYRTTVGGTGPLYRLTVDAAANELFNDPTAASVSFVDTRSDANFDGTGTALDVQPQLYTSEELEDVPPPAFVAEIVHRGRLIGLAPDLRTAWASKDIIEDLGVLPGFNEALTLTFDTDKNALASLDANWVAFGPASIDIITGDGPDANGGENNWQIQPIQTDVGCTNPLSVVAFPGGVFFQSGTKLYALSRGFEVSWAGRPMMATLAAFPVITSAVLVPDLHELRWTCNASDGSAGVVVVFDYLNNKWFTRTYKDASDTGASSTPIQDAALIDGAWTFVTPGGQVYIEDTTTFLDGRSAWVTRDVELAWVGPAITANGQKNSLVSWFRVKACQVLGTSVTDHDLEVSLARDYQPGWEKVSVFPATTEGVAVGPYEKVHTTMLTQKVTAVRARLRDLTPSAPGVVGNGAGPIWEAIAFEVKPKTGLPKTSAVEQG